MLCNCYNVEARHLIYFVTQPVDFDDTEFTFFMYQGLQIRKNLKINKSRRKSIE